MARAMSVLLIVAAVSGGIMLFAGQVRSLVQAQEPEPLETPRPGCRQAPPVPVKNTQVPPSQEVAVEHYLGSCPGAPPPLRFVVANESLVEIEVISVTPYDDHEGGRAAISILSPRGTHILSASRDTDYRNMYCSSPIAGQVSANSRTCYMFANDARLVVRVEQDPE